MLKKKIIFFLLSLGLIISLFSTWSISRTLKSIHKENIELKSSLFNYEYNNKRDKEKYAQNLFSENQHLSDLALLDSNSDTISLASIMNNTKLVYRFYQGTCVQCVEDELDIAKQLADSIGANNILIISDFDKISSLKAITNRKQITSPCFIYKGKFELPIEKDDNEIASFFLLDKDLRTRFVFKAGGAQNINDTYYKRVINFFKNKY